MTDDDALGRVLGMAPQDFAEAAGRIADVPAWYVERLADWTGDEAPPAPYELADWYQRGSTWERTAFWPVERLPALVMIVDDRSGQCEVRVCDREGRALPVVTARNPVEGREIADVLLAGLGWEIRA